MRYHALRQLERLPGRAAVHQSWLAADQASQGFGVGLLDGLARSAMRSSIAARRGSPPAGGDHASWITHPEPREFPSEQVRPY
jgi:hypothetical protein